MALNPHARPFRASQPTQSTPPLQNGAYTPQQEFHQTFDPSASVPGFDVHLLMCSLEAAQNKENEVLHREQLVSQREARNMEAERVLGERFTQLEQRELSQKRQEAAHTERVQLTEKKLAKSTAELTKLQIKAMDEMAAARGELVQLHIQETTEKANIAKLRKEGKELMDALAYVAKAKREMEAELAELKGSVKLAHSEPGL